MVAMKGIKAMFGAPGVIEHVGNMLKSGLEAHKLCLGPGSDGGKPLVANSVPAGAFAVYEEAVAVFPKLAAAILERVTTLVHKDVRLDNMIFAADGRVLLLDWQAYADGVAISDIVQFCTFNLNHAGCLNKDVDRELLEEYRVALVAALGDKISDVDKRRLSAEQVGECVCTAVFSRVACNHITVCVMRLCGRCMRTIGWWCCGWRWQTRWRGWSKRRTMMRASLCSLSLPVSA